MTSGKKFTFDFSKKAELISYLLHSQ